MPHLHLPAEHSDADLVLAATLVSAVDSDELYVAWTHDAGAGAIPEIEALVRDERTPLPLAPLLAGALAALVAAWAQWGRATPEAPG